MTSSSLLNEPESGASCAASLEPSALLASIFNSCTTHLGDDSPLYSTADKKINHLLSSDQELGNFEQWLQDKVVPTVQAHMQAHSQKQLNLAKQYKLFADSYANMVELVFQDKALHCLNMALIYAPFNEVDFLVDCLVARAAAHRRVQSYHSALIDLNRALTLNPLSWLAIARMVDMYKLLNRSEEAYQFVKGLKKQVGMKQFKHELSRMKRNLKPFKPRKVEKNIQEIKPESKEFHLSVSPRVEWAVNEWNNRLYLKANGFIPSGEVVLQEQPVLSVVRSQSLLSYCNHCCTKCHNTFWPCTHCTEVVFCSDNCAQLATYHRLECGISGLLASKVSSKVNIQAKEIIQVYRQLALVGHERMVQLDAQAIDRTYTKANLHTKASGMSREEAQSLFALSSSDWRHFLLTRQPVLPVANVAGAIYLFGIYCYKNEIDSVDQHMLTRVIRCLALELTKVACAEFGWFELEPENSEESSSTRMHISQYQCLVSSRLGHSCVPNVDWKYDGRRFSLTTTKPIEAGQEIAISFISTKGDSTLFNRLTCLSPFYRCCACVQCRTEASQCFALRCTREHCDGSIPFDSKRYAALQCMQCEQPFMYGMGVALAIEQDFKQLQRTVSLIQGMMPDLQPQHIELIERKLTSMVLAMHSSNELLLSLLGDFCQEYIRRDKFCLAVEWRHWLLHKEITLPNPRNDQLIYLHELDQWAEAYLYYLSGLDSEEQVLPKYIEEAREIFDAMFALLAKLKHNKELKKSLLINWKQFKSVIGRISASLEGKWTRFKSFCESVQCDGPNDHDLSHQCLDSTQFTLHYSSDSVSSISSYLCDDKLVDNSEQQEADLSVM